MKSRRFETRNTLQLSSKIRLTAYKKGTKEVVAVIESHNVIPTVGKQFVGDMLIDKDVGHDTGITYCAIGTSNTTPAVTDTQLTAEANRKQITSRSRVSNVITLSTFFTAADCTYNIKEAGEFGHSTATATPNSGKLFAHWLVTFDNSTGNYDLTFDYVLTIG